MGYDDVIGILGEYGWYQKKIHILLCIPAIICAFHKLGNVFLLAEPSYRCTLPDEFPENASFHLNQTELDKWFPNNNLDHKCQIHFNNEMQDCTHFVYDNHTYGYTAVIEWQLTCEKATLVATSNSLFMVGVMVGSIGFGELSDRWGRKNTFFLSLVIQVVFGVIAALSPEFWSFSIARLIVGATTSGVFLVAYVIGLEMIGNSKRVLAGVLYQMFFSMGYMLTAVCALYVTNWRSLQYLLTLPGLVFFSYYWIIPESPRWLVSKNRITEAKKFIQINAKGNKVKISDDTLNAMLMPTPEEKEKNKTNTSNGKKTSVLDLFRYPSLRRRSMIIFFDWFANNITYYGLSWNTNNLAGDPYVNFVISGAVEIPAYTFVIFSLNVWGRRNVMCGCMMLSGCALLLTMVVPKDLQWISIGLAMFGKLAITASYGSVYIVSTEQFPTVIRNAALGAGSTFARFGAITAPYINIMSHLWKPLPLIIFGSLAFVGGLMSLTLPETLGQKLPETMEEGENFGKTRKNHLEDNLTTLKTTEEDLEAQSNLLKEEKEKF